ncbi:MAG: hypothetical protein GY906_38620 [bacterium]|nr:hypothetical protein [bacterium]
MFEGELVNLLATLSGLAGVLLTGALSAPIKKLDYKVQNFIKPFKPMIAVGLGIGLPMLANAIGISDIPAEALMDAPLGTVLGISMREAAKRLKGRKGAQL